MKILFFPAPELTRGEDFGYDGNIGPTHWGERYRECTGKHQSPININVLRVKQVALPDINFIGFDDSIDDVHVTNNGHTGKPLLLLATSTSCCRPTGRFHMSI
ncbi:hypothetical protein MSG28_002880 [Choristoneura fumiferana]|uniref:Uncharacterized protein n=1 Tax=Choristoneura fumiferana TaxID=7141 RepID=A0ACC0JJN8_CHOFU|nr:hypothetical protein MSG28_002880 [Choristoneura fumiferana]